jgi:hypothetical protein
LFSSGRVISLVVEPYTKLKAAIREEPKRTSVTLSDVDSLGKAV